jgi:ubiquinone/menaquinone biosynthesis C-methylase UbiE
MDRISDAPRSQTVLWAAADDAARYERGRPGYSPQLAGLLTEELALKAGTRVVDVAAGTGKLTRVLAATLATVTAVEPQFAMLGQLRPRLAHTDVIVGTAEHLPIRTSSVDAVTVGQAFHWFELPDASRELRRVLRRGGTLAVVANRRHEPDRWIQELWTVLGRYEKLAPNVGSNQGWRNALEQTGDFTDFDRFELPNEQRFLDLADFDARFTSVSYVMLLDDAARAALLRDLHEVIAGMDPIVIPLRTVVEVARRRQ